MDRTGETNGVRWTVTEPRVLRDHVQVDLQGGPVDRIYVVHREEVPAIIAAMTAAVGRDQAAAGRGAAVHVGGGGDQVMQQIPRIRNGSRRQSSMAKLPSAKEVRDVLGHVDIGAYRVSRNMMSAQQNWRFLWRVLGPEQTDGTREIIEEHASYRGAVADARRMERLRLNVEEMSVDAGATDAEVRRRAVAILWSDALAEKVVTLVEILRDVQWMRGDDLTGTLCVECGAGRDDDGHNHANPGPHEFDCRLALAIGAPRKPEE